MGSILSKNQQTRKEKHCWFFCSYFLYSLLPKTFEHALCYISKKLNKARFGLFRAMRAAAPAARPTHTAQHLIQADRDAAASGFVFLRLLYPTNPFIPRQRRNIRPYTLHLRIGLYCLPKIRRYPMYHTRGNSLWHISYLLAASRWGATALPMLDSI